MAAFGYIRPYQPPGAPVILSNGDSLLHHAVPDAGTGPSWTYSYRGGYRRHIYAGVQAARGVVPTMIGAMLNSTDGLALSVAGLAHTGINAAHTPNWIASYWGTCKPVWEAQGTPNIILLSTGANDGNTTDAGDTIGAFADLHIAAYPNAAILVSNCTPNLDAARDVINASIAANVAARAAAGKHIGLVDAYNAVPATTEYFPDGLHLSDTGYALLADRWINAILPLVRG